MHRIVSWLCKGPTGYRKEYFKAGSLTLHSSYDMNKKKQGMRRSRCVLLDHDNILVLITNHQSIIFIKSLSRLDLDVFPGLPHIL